MAEHAATAGGDYDLLIIGGGIHGVGIAQAAAAAGYSVLCLEKEGWGSATSSRSSKLIHGGLRYLQTAQLRLVRRCLLERDLLVALAPELVSLRSFYIPVYKQGRYRPWQIRWGLRLYHLLSGWRDSGLYSLVPRSRWADLDGLNTDQLEAVYRYYDGQTDDQQLTQAVKNSAVALGATMQCPACFVEAAKNGQGYSVTYSFDGKPCQVQCRVLVNASGPWVNQTLQQIEHTLEPLPIDLIQGAHLLYPGNLTDHCFYVEAPQDGRAVFILPWQGKTLVGTTETQYEGDPGAAQPLAREVEYLRRTLAHYFPHWHAEPEAQFCGVRVLPKSGRAVFLRSRDTQLLLDDPRKPHLVSLYGGKLTDYRATSAKLVDTLIPTLGWRASRVDTADLPLLPVKR